MLDLVAAASPARGFTFVGIGGHGGAGKSTLAARIPGAQVVGTDEFWDGEGFELRRATVQRGGQPGVLGRGATPSATVPAGMSARRGRRWRRTQRARNDQ